MKIRSGFVSNSSSSSFVVYTDCSMNVLKGMIHDYEVDCEGDLEWIQESLNKIHQYILDHPDENKGYVLPFTCNYETFIFPCIDGKTVQVYTCNNHFWELEELGKTRCVSNDWIGYSDEEWDETTMFYDIVKDESKTYDEWDNFWTEEFDKKWNES